MDKDLARQVGGGREKKKGPGPTEVARGVKYRGERLVGSKRAGIKSAGTEKKDDGQKVAWNG